jgi:hypothetical protein
MKIISDIEFMEGMIEGEQVPIRIIAVASRTPVLIYNKY